MPNAYLLVVVPFDFFLHDQLGDKSFLNICRKTQKNKFFHLSQGRGLHRKISYLGANTVRLLFTVSQEETLRLWEQCHGKPLRSILVNFIKNYAAKRYKLFVLKSFVQHQTTTTLRGVPLICNYEATQHQLKQPSSELGYQHQEADFTGGGFS